MSTARLADLVSGEKVANEDLPCLRQFLARVEEVCDDRYRLRHGEERLAGQLADTYAFLRDRRRDEILIRTFPLEPVEEAAREANTMLEVVLPDQPFIVDTIDLFLSFAGLEVVSRLYLAVPIRRDRGGRVASLSETTKTGPRETLVRFEILGRLDEELCENLERALLARLLVARAVVRDFKAMTSRMRKIARALKRLQRTAPKSAHPNLMDTRALIEWLLAENFILMGISFYPHDALDPLVPDPERQLGYTHLGHEELLYCGQRIREAGNEARVEGEGGPGSCALVYKSQEESLIHRAGKIDNIVLRGYDEEGAFEGCYHLRGLFTFRAIRTPGAEIPIVRLKLKELLVANKCKPHSLRWKAYTNAFNSIPVEFLFESPSAEIGHIVDTILDVEKDKELRTHVVVDPENRKGLYFLVLPRQSYAEEMRRRIESILLEGLAATYSDSRVYIGKYDTVLLSFFFTAAERFREFSRAELDERVRSVARTWEERFYYALVEEMGEPAAQTLLERYRQAFPEEYRLIHSPEEAVADVRQLERVRPRGGRAISFEVLYTSQDRGERLARLRVYLRRNVYLSTMLPIFDNFGLRIVDQSTFRVHAVGGGELFIETFRVAGVTGDDHPLIEGKQKVLEALEIVFARHAANDSLNRLTIEAGLGWRDVDLLRSYLHYLRQLGVPNSIASMSETFRQYPQITRLLLDLYRARFSPDLDWTLEERDARRIEIEEEVRAALHDVRTSAEDEVLRLLMNLFAATLRTNRYQERSPDEHTIAFKIDSHALMVSTEPRPWREIYVHHHQMEGIHIRGGPLARGGIRWSDRNNDYREEILDLMRTQMVKNVLIVPVGAKGGFVIRRPDSDPARRRTQADTLYRVFIGALLDLTDNVVGTGVVQPPRVVCYDGEDTYLVVAADKGTAHLSDTANEISQARSFWLGDAFASGGSHGYDHKALGITARGAWVGVQRHFREMHLDPNRDVFTVVGIGDMAGDVFGNGMLMSSKLKLLAAFNHQHIFIDPSPNPDESYHERERLFATRHSTWCDYDPKLISAGGGVFDRHAKILTLAPEAQRLLGLTESEARPAEVIRRILTLEVDLLWNGGIGTYIKASHEDNRDVGDLANAEVRVNARQVRARVIGEGGNLGATQAGRVEYALRGGRVNTDFVDNSAGVNCSDHEVNLKILLAVETANGKLDSEERNRLLREMEEDVCESVLEQSYFQCLMISLDEVRSRDDLFSFERTIKFLEDRGYIQRDRDVLPNLEALTQRQAQGRGMTRPELALIGASVKMEVSRRLLELPPDALPGLEDYLTSYFSDVLVERYENQLSRHLLGREIAITVVTNMIIDHAGASFFFDVEREAGASADEILRAYVLADELYECWGMKERVISLDGRVPVESQYAAIISIENSIRNTLGWLLGADGRLAQVERDKVAYRALLEEYETRLPRDLSSKDQDRFRESADVYYRGGFEIGLPERLARFRFLTSGLRIADICFHTGTAVEDATRLYFQVGHHTAINPLVKRCDETAFGGRWDTLALRIARNSLLDSLCALVQRQIRRQLPGRGPDWVAEGVRELERDKRLGEVLIDIRKMAAEELTVAAVQVLMSRLRSLCGGRS